MSGELETRLSVRDCKGVCGTEFDRRKVRRAVAFTRSFEDDCFCTIFCADARIASVNVFKVALITSVASIDRCLGDRMSSHSCVSAWAAAFFVRVFVVVVFALSFEGFFEARAAVGFGAIGFGRSKSLSRVRVDDVQVEIDCTCSRTRSAVELAGIIVVELISRYW